MGSYKGELSSTIVSHPYNLSKEILEWDTTGGPPSSYEGAVILHDSYLYTIGGKVKSTKETNCDVYRLDLRTHVWECLSHSSLVGIEEVRHGSRLHRLVQDDSHIYLLGGYAYSDIFGFEQLPAFHVVSKKWSMRSTKPDPLAPHPGYPTARHGLACVQYKTLSGQTEVIIVGGYDFVGITVYHKDIWRINLSTMQWHLFQSAQLPADMFDYDIATSGNGLVYLVGIQNRVKTYQIYKMWVTVPKLSEMCWEAIVALQPKLHLYPAAWLRKLGIPDRFVNRLNRQAEGC